MAGTVIDAVAGRTKEASSHVIDKAADLGQSIAAKAQDAAGNLGDKAHDVAGSVTAKIAGSSSADNQGTAADGTDSHHSHSH